MERIIHTDLSYEKLNCDEHELLVLAHTIDGYEMFAHKYPQQSYMKFLSQAEQDFEQSQRFTDSLEDLAILLFLAARRHRHFDCGAPNQVFFTPFVEALVERMKQLLTVST